MKYWSYRALILLSLTLLSLSGAVGCATTSGAVVTSPDGGSHDMHGIASWYGANFQGRPTASGEPFDVAKHTAAHRTLPFGTMVRVRCVETRKTVVVRINDRGPFTAGRVIDLSEAAARDLGMIQAGIIPVELEILRW